MVGWARQREMKVVGTAGHIDHGKSALVRALTGIDPDRLEDERRRGMTIDLGFAWLTLPSGTTISIVDVPGHERFVKNMLAGAGGIDVALLVIAADESVMPQTREHMDILDLLGVRSGVVALTKSDLVDREWMDLVTSDVSDFLVGTSLEGSAIVPVSSVTRVGLPELLHTLDAAVSAARSRENIGMPLLPIDRVFTIGGFGTVVTGTLQDGSLSVGSELEIEPQGKVARVRGLQVHERQVDQAAPGDRVAVNLAGIDKEQVHRGDVLAARGTVSGLRRFDARLRVVREAPFSLADDARVTLHVGSAEQPATVSLVEPETLAPGEQGWATIRTDRPVVAIPGQRFIIRLPAPARTIGGGTVAHTGRPIKRRKERLALLELLHGQSVEDRVIAWLQIARWGTRTDALAELRLPLAAVDAALGNALETGRTVQVGDGYMTAEGWNDVRARAEEAVNRFHRDQPLKRGISREELRARLHVPPGRWQATVAKLVAEDVVVDAGDTLGRPGRVGGIVARRQEADRVLALLDRYALAPPAAAELAREGGTDPGLIEALAEEGEVVRADGGMFFAPHIVEQFSRDVLAMIDERGSVTAAEVRDAVHTSRKYVLALLEYLDNQRITRRAGDVRVRGSRAPACV
jgi:selenocysteine-specific elongation factor